ncbi:50S ribosomal protein L24, partial [Candidatus Pacearchaeota archaeon]|nr:50S ribosomal protein L24 [Candidatus Pacearchaeota archaeon]
MPKCSYCGENYDSFKGLTLVKNDGSVNHLCSSKCIKNMKMDRRNVKWISKKKKSGSKKVKETKEEK